VCRATRFLIADIVVWCRRFYVRFWDPSWSFSFHHFIYFILWKASSISFLFRADDDLLFQVEFVKRFVMFLRRSTEARTNWNLIIALCCIENLGFNFSTTKLDLYSSQSFLFFFRFLFVLFCLSLKCANDAEFYLRWYAPETFNYEARRTACFLHFVIFPCLLPPFCVGVKPGMFEAHPLLLVLIFRFEDSIRIFFLLHGSGGCQGSDSEQVV
jgi:hypothetical protein